MATDNWLANTGDWTTVGDWDSGVPTSSSDVFIGNNMRAGTATSSGTVVINTLKLRNGDGLSVNGGTFEVTNGTPDGIFGVIIVENAFFKVDDGTINNSGEIELAPLTNTETYLVITDTVELNGAGSIVFSGNGNDAIIGGDPTSKLINSDNTISGNGSIEEIFFTNDGTIETNNADGAQTLNIWGSAFMGNFDNEGSVFADNGGTLQFGLSGHSSTIINNNTIEALSDGSATNIEIAGNVTIQGSGQILFGGSRPDDDVIVSDGLSATLNLDGGTLSGAGNLGDAHLTLNIEAGTTVKATSPFFDINTGANTVTNAGLIIVSADGGGLSIQSAVQNTGTVLATNPDGSLSFVAQGNTNGPTGVIQALGGNIGLFGSITNNGGLIQVGSGGEIIVTSDILGLNGGQIEIGSGGLLDLRSGGTVSQGVEFTGAGGTLELDQDAGQIGTDISGLTIADSIDLGFLSFAAGDHTVWTQTSGGEGTITVEAANGSLLATLVVEGTWNSQDFDVTEDEGGGTLVAVQPPSYAENPGNNDEWIMADGHWVASAGPGSHPSGYNVAGIGDWTGGGTDGILWFNPTTGDADEWQLANTQWAASVDLGTHPGNFQISGVGDFFGNGIDDVLWTSASGDGVQTDIWKLGSNGEWAASFSPGTHPAGYNVAGVGDWTGSGTEGILWHNASTGDTDEWQLSGGQWAASVDLGSHPGNYQISGVGDFFGNGRDDVLWTGVNGNGTVSTDIWELNSSGQWMASISPGAHPAGYQVVGVGDFTGTGTSDILWYNASTGDADEWLIKNGQWAGSIDLGTHPGGFQIAGVGDFNGHGNAGVLWHSPS